jgi:hypothetical protein
VTVVVSNATATRRYPASRVDGEYVVPVDEIRLAPGMYSVYAVAANGNDAPGPTNELIGISDSSRIDLKEDTAGTGTEENASAESGEETETINATSANATPPDESGPTVLSPNLSANETAEEGSTDDEAGGTPFALLSLVVIIGYFAVRGPNRMD